MMKLDEARAREVLTFWLGEHEGTYGYDPEIAARWFKKDLAFDEEIRRRFGALIEAAQEEQLAEEPPSPTTRLAHIILLDQLSRNAFRGDKRMYKGDAHALSLTKEALAEGQDASLSVIERVFLYMPLMHSEALPDQEECVRLFRALVEGLPEDVREAPLGRSLEQSLWFADRHLEIVERFGRFPHRNEILGRETTEEERRFLQEPNSSF